MNTGFIQPATWKEAIQRDSPVWDYRPMCNKSMLLLIGAKTRRLTYLQETNFGGKILLFRHLGPWSERDINLVGLQFTLYGSEWISPQTAILMLLCGLDRVYHFQCHNSRLTHSMTPIQVAPLESRGKRMGHSWQDGLAAMIYFSLEPGCYSFAMPPPEASQMLSKRWQTGRDPDGLCMLFIPSMC